MDHPAVEPLGGYGFQSYVTWSPHMGLYCRWGDGVITGFHSEYWGGYYYIGSYRPYTTNPYAPATPLERVGCSNIGAFEVNPWSKIDYEMLDNLTKLGVDRLKAMVGTVLVSRQVTLDLGRAQLSDQ